MCGFSGIYAPKLSIKYNDISFRFFDRIKHRGPDAGEIFIMDDVGVYHHQRLSINGLGHVGRQPVLVKKRGILMFNGEIYNHLRLRDIYNLHIDNSSDTQTLLHLILELGFEKAVKLCEGPMAVAFHDFIENKISLYRDPFGEKPLYYVVNENSTLQFSSRLDAIANNLEIKNASQQSYLQYGFDVTDENKVGEVCRLGPGRILEYDGENLDVTNTSIESLGLLSPIVRVDEQARLISEVKDALIQNIGETLLSDVPVSGFLSGGVDSSFITGIASKYFPNKIQKCFTATFDDNNLDESPRALMVAERFGVDLTPVKIEDADVKQYLSEISGIFDAPFYDPACVALHKLCRAAKQKDFKVAITGDGADELFGGYFRHNLGLRLYKILKNIGQLSFAINTMSRLNLKNQRLNSLFQKATGLIECETLAEYYAYTLSQGITRDGKIFEQLFDKSQNAFRSMLEADILYYIPKNVCVKNDSVGMYQGLELRTPFLRSDLLRKLNQLPDHSFKSKKLLIDVGKDLLGFDLRSGMKKSFQMPLSRWNLLAKDYLKDTKIPTYSMQRSVNNAGLQKLIWRECVLFAWQKGNGIHL